MTNHPTYTAADALTHVGQLVALAAECACEISQRGEIPPAEEMLQTHIETLLRIGMVLREHLEALSIRPEKYSDGRSSFATTPLGNGRGITVVWHPDPTHATNLPRVVVSELWDGGRPWRVFVPAPGHLEAVPLDDPNDPDTA